MSAAGDGATFATLGGSPHRNLRQSIRGELGRCRIERVDLDKRKRVKPPLVRLHALRRAELHPPISLSDPTERSAAMIATVCHVSTIRN